MRPLAVPDFRPKSAFAPGPAPMLQWVRVDQLVIDDRYQREVRDTGRRNILAIAEAFDWTKFAPLIVSPVEGGLFAVIDGQHRATAAAARGIEQLPAQVVIADVAAQAAAFRAVNGQATRVGALDLHAAALAAGEPRAAALVEILDLAGVTVPRHPKEMSRMAVGETLAVGVLSRLLAQVGRDTLITALQCITETSNNVPNALSATAIRAIARLLAESPAWREAGERLLTAFDEIDLEAEVEAARTSRRARGLAGWKVLSDRLALALHAALGASGAEAALHPPPSWAGWTAGRPPRAHADPVPARIH